MTPSDELLARLGICYVTGNPCGTDTIIVGHGDCPGNDGICYKRRIRTLQSALATERNDALERAAKVCDEITMNHTISAERRVGRLCKEAIRALKVSAPGGEG